jgi:hypothetical protein
MKLLKYYGGPMNKTPVYECSNIYRRRDAQWLCDELHCHTATEHPRKHIDFCPVRTRYSRLANTQEHKERDSWMDGLYRI